MLNGKVPVVEKFRWFPYQAIRAGTADGLAIETVNRMVFDDRGVLWRITLSNTEPTEVAADVSIGELIGDISELTTPGSVGLGLRPTWRGRPEAALRGNRSRSRRRG